MAPDILDVKFRPEDGQLSFDDNDLSDAYSCAPFGNLVFQTNVFSSLCREYCKLLAGTTNFLGGSPAMRVILEGLLLMAGLEGSLGALLMMGVAGMGVVV